MLNISEDSLIFFVIMSSALLLVLLGFFFAFIQLYRRKQLLFQTEQKQRELEYNEELVRTQLEIREQVMRQISEELHDNIGQSLIVAKMQLNATESSGSLKQLKTTDELLSRSIQDLRNISKSLNGDYILREELINAIHREARFVNASGQITCKVNGTIPRQYLNTNTEIIVFRCVQEALGNAIKHAQANKISIDFEESNNQLTIKIRDNGIGLAKNWDSKRGLGIDNLKKRVAMINGTVDITSKQDRGTEISIKLQPTNQPIDRPT